MKHGKYHIKLLRGSRSPFALNDISPVWEGSPRIATSLRGSEASLRRQAAIGRLLAKDERQSPGDSHFPSGEIAIGTTSYFFAIDRFDHRCCRTYRYFVLTGPPAKNYSYAEFF